MILISLSENISLGETTCEIVATFEGDSLNDVELVYPVPTCLSWWSV